MTIVTAICKGFWVHQGPIRLSVTKSYDDARDTPLVERAECLEPFTSLGWTISVGLDKTKRDGTVVVSAVLPGGRVRIGAELYRTLDTDQFTLASNPKALAILVRRLCRD